MHSSIRIRNYPRFENNMNSYEQNIQGYPQSYYYRFYFFDARAYFHCCDQQILEKPVEGRAKSIETYSGMCLDFYNSDTFNFSSSSLIFCSFFNSFE